MKKYQKLAIILSLGLSLIGCGGVGTEEDPALLPIAVNDIATVIENGAEITILVLDNDKPNGQFNASTVKIITDPESAESFSVVPSTGAVKYKPKLGFFGTDSLVYQVENSKGNFSNPATVAITVTQLPDKTAPVITINGGDETIEVGTGYIDKGATALDKVDGVVTVTALSTVKKDIPGSYTVTYTATDAATNTATAIRKVTVADSTPPVITMKGSSTVSIEKLKQYIDDGATAIDNIDGAIPVSVVSTVDTNVVADNYTVTYTATDNQGNKTEAIRYVSVTPEIITLIGADHIHKNCDGTVDKTGPDTNDNGILEDSEVTTLENAAYTEGPPVTREELDSMIKKNDNLVSINTCEIEDMSSLFLGKADFNQNIIKWNVGSVTNMSKMFENATTFNGNIGSWDVRSVTDMSQMFRGASRFLDGNIDAWGDKTKNVTRMDAMFDQATAFNGNIGSWDVSSVTDMSLMFFVASSFADGNIGAWGDKTKNVKEMDHMFSNTPFNGDIGSWDVSSVIDMEDMFRGASEFVDGNIGEWEDDVKNVENMRFMFNRTSSFNGDISGWNVSSVKEMDAMFEQATAFNGNIGSWDVRSVTNMKRMFENSGFDQDIGNWDVSLVTDMTDMFKGITLTATNYNKLLIGWWNIIAQGGSLQPGVNFDGGNSVLSSAEAIKPWLQLQNHPSVAPFANSPNWTITDGGCKIQGCP